MKQVLVFVTCVIHLICAKCLGCYHVIFKCSGLFYSGRLVCARSIYCLHN